MPHGCAHCPKPCLKPYMLNKTYFNIVCYIIGFNLKTFQKIWIAKSRKKCLRINFFYFAAAALTSGFTKKELRVIDLHYLLISRYYEPLDSHDNDALPWMMRVPDKKAHRRPAFTDMPYYTFKYRSSWHVMQQNCCEKEHHQKELPKWPSCESRGS